MARQGKLTAACVAIVCGAFSLCSAEDAATRNYNPFEAFVPDDINNVPFAGMFVDAARMGAQGVQQFADVAKKGAMTFGGPLASMGAGNPLGALNPMGVMDPFGMASGPLEALNPLSAFVPGGMDGSFGAGGLLADRMNPLNFFESLGGMSGGGYEMAMGGGQLDGVQFDGAQFSFGESPRADISMGVPVMQQNTGTSSDPPKMVSPGQVGDDAIDMHSNSMKSEESVGTVRGRPNVFVAGGYATKPYQGASIGESIPICTEEMAGLRGFDPYTAFLSFMEFANPLGSMFPGGMGLPFGGFPGIPSFRSSKIAHGSIDVHAAGTGSQGSKAVAPTSAGVATADILAQVQQADAFLSLFPDMEPMIRSFACVVELSPLRGHMDIANMLPLSEFMHNPGSKFMFEDAKALILNPLKLGLLPLRFFVLMTLVPKGTAKLKLAKIPQKFKGIAKGFLAMKAMKIKAGKMFLKMMSLKAALGFKLLIKGLEGFKMMFLLFGAKGKMKKLMLGSAIKSQLFQIFVMGAKKMLKSMAMMKAMWFLPCKKGKLGHDVMPHIAEPFFAPFRETMVSQDGTSPGGGDIGDPKHIFVALIDNHAPAIYRWEREVAGLMYEYEGFLSHAAIDGPGLLEQPLSEAFDNNPLISQKIGNIFNVDFEALEEPIVRFLSGIQDSDSMSPSNRDHQMDNFGGITQELLDAHLAKMGTLVQLDSEIIREVKGIITQPGPSGDKMLLDTITSFAKQISHFPTPENTVSLAQQLSNPTNLAHTHDTIKQFILTLPE